MHIRISSRAASLLAAASLATTSVLLFCLAGPAMADETPAGYVANIRQHVAFLDQASRLAAEHSTNDKVRAFAKAQSAEQQAVSNDLKSWEAGQPTGGLTSPMVVASAPDSNPPPPSDKVVTGRSAAIDRDESIGVLMASPGVIVLPQLATLKGDSFDELYETTQAASLKELAGLYEAYSMTGKNPALRALALRELPLVKQRISELDGL